MTGFDPNYYNNSDICKNHGNINMARTPSYGQNDNRPQFRVPYGPKEPHCPCYNHNGQPEKLPPIKRPEHPDDYYTNPPFIPSMNQCNCQIPDRFPVSNIINVESRLMITLKVTLYGVKEEDDVTVILECGKKYKFIYLTEDGVREVIGTLRYIDSSIPTECIRYIGNNNEITNYAYIIIDASTEGSSNIVKIFIRSLRGIEEVKPSEGTDNNTEGNDSGNTGTGTDAENPDTGNDSGNTENPPSTGEDNSDNNGTDNPDTGDTGNDSGNSENPPSTGEDNSDNNSDNTETENPPSAGNDSDITNTENNSENTNTEGNTSDTETDTNVEDNTQETP